MLSSNRVTFIGTDDLCSSERLFFRSSGAIPVYYPLTFMSPYATLDGSPSRNTRPSRRGVSKSKET